MHEVDLEPFFISKYEMTQGQWKRLTGRNPFAGALVTKIKPQLAEELRLQVNSTGVVVLDAREPERPTMRRPSGEGGHR